MARNPAEERRHCRSAPPCVLELLEKRELLASGASSLSPPPARPDHVVIVMEEDRACNAIGDPQMPYFNELAASGLVYSNSHGVAHPGLLDYLALYSGSTQGVTDNWGGYSFSGPNLAKSLFAAGLSFAGYSESLPANGSQVIRASDLSVDPDGHPDVYVRRYNPMAQFTDIGPGRVNADVNKTFNSFPSSFADLPTVSLVVPDMFHNTHGSDEPPYTDASSDRSRLRINADAWLRDKFSAYAEWTRTHNSLLIVTGDEEEYTTGSADTVTTIVVGDPRLVTPGVNSAYINHYNLLRTIEDMYGLAPLGNSASAAAFGSDSGGKLAPDPIVPAPTTTLLASLSNPSRLGRPVSFAATVLASGIPTGAVSFMEGSAILGSVQLDAFGRATFTTSSLTLGSHSITAVYGGDSRFAGSTSATLTQQVARMPTKYRLALLATAAARPASPAPASPARLARPSEPLRPLLELLDSPISPI